MCGILFTLSPSTQSDSHVTLVSSRGPDTTRSEKVPVDEQTLTFTFSLLSLRGDSPTPQPISTPSSGSILCWNGEAWRIDSHPLEPGQCDTTAVLALLDEEVEEGDGDILKAMKKVQGEYAFVFFDRRREVVWYGRDWAGRRSLVKKRGSEGGLVVASVIPSEEAVGNGWEEVVAGGLWRVDVREGREEWVEVDGLWKWTLSTELSTNPLTSTSSEVSQLYNVLSESVRLRVLGVPEPPHPDGTTPPSRIAILFSGGVDCTTIARLAHDHLPPGEDIDLLNVAFENPRVMAARRAEAKKVGDRVDGEMDAYELCPDRVTGLSSWGELVRVCKGRRFNFVKVDVPFEVFTKHRERVISLMRPHNTEMDLSIAAAFYFASMGVGTLYPGGEGYETKARILLSGLGADELFGGYSRHAVTFKRSGYEGVREELETEINRIGKRNLGRDDRVLACWGREARYPFLDETVVSWTAQTPVDRKCPFGDVLEEEEDGDREAEKGKGYEPGKRVLRFLLGERLGMRGAAGEKKRAVQFGARTAKMTTGGRGAKGQDLLSSCA